MVIKNMNHFADVVNELTWNAAPCSLCVFHRAACSTNVVLSVEYAAEMLDSTEFNFREDIKNEEKAYRNSDGTNPFDHVRGSVCK